MQVHSKFFCLMLFASAFIILLSIKRSGKFFCAAFLTVIQGVSALFAVNLISSVTGVSLAINWVSVCISAIGGVFGVVGLLVARVILFV